MTTNIPKRPKARKKTTKGIPPSDADVIVNNTDKPETGKLKPLNFKVMPDFHREFKMFAVTHGVSMTHLLYESFRKYRDKS